MGYHGTLSWFRKVPVESEAGHCSYFLKKVLSGGALRVTKQHLSSTGNLAGGSSLDSKLNNAFGHLWTTWKRSNYHEKNVIEPVHKRDHFLFCYSVLFDHPINTMNQGRRHAWDTKSGEHHFSKMYSPHMEMSEQVWKGRAGRIPARTTEMIP